MAWQPPEDELDTNVLQQSKPPEDELVKNIPDQWSPPKDELAKSIPDQWSPPEDELDNSPTKIKDEGTLQQMKQSGQELTREQERILFDAEDKKEFTQKASEAITTFVPTAIDIAKQLGTGAGEFLYKGVLKPIDSMSQSDEEVEKTWKEAKNTWRSGVSGVAGDIQETADAAVRFSMFGSSITDKLLGKSNDERFEKYMLREGMRQFAQKVYADDPDNAARLLAENPLLQKLASAAALAQGATPEEAELAKKAYEELVKEQGLTKDEINENVSMLGEILSPISLPGTNRITNTFAKATGKVTRKAGELALKGVVAPLAKGVAKTAGGLESGIEKIQGASRKIGEYAVGDPDTFVKTATNTIVGPAKLPAKMTRGIATTIGDVASQAGQGRRGMFELAGRSPTSGELTKKLFGPQAMGGKGRARVADWAVRQSNAIIQPAVNGAVLNVALGLPDIETARDLGYSAGVGAGIGAYGGARLMERGGALIDPTTGLAEKIDAIVTPDPSQLRKDEDADIQRFIKTADPTLMSSIDELSNVNNIKSALDLKIKNLEAKKVAQINKDDERRIQDQIDNFAEQRKALDKSTPQTEAEIKRQVQLSFTDAMDLAKTTGAAAGLNNIQVKVLRPDQMEDFYRNLYGKTLTDAESVVQQLVGNPRLSPSEKEMLGLADQTIKQYLQDVAGSSTARGFAISEQTGKPNHLKMQNQTGATVVINGDLVTQMGRDGLNLGRVINHEMQHALSNFQEVRDMIAPIRKELFDQKVINPDGTFEVVKKGVIPDSELDKFALQYAAAMDASGGASFLSNFANQDQLRNYMKEEYLSELAGLSGGIQGNLRSNLDSVGRSVVDWIESRTKNGALKRVKEALRNYGVIVDDQGQFSSVIGGELNPEALAMMRQYQRGLRDLNESLVYNSDPVKDEAEIPLTVFSTNRALQQRYKDSEFFEQQQVVKMTTPDGQTQEIVIPPNVKVDSFISDYRFANGQLVDELGNVISLGPDIPLQAMPDGTSLSVDTRIARNADGSPRIISPRESKRRAKKRGEAIRKAIDEAPEDASGVRLEDTGNGNYRGTLSPTQVAAINALPNDLVAPSLKRKIAFFNEILGRKDGSIVEIEYQAAIRDKKYRALQPQMRTEIPFGFQFDKQGNFLMTTMSMSRMHDKANAWAAKRPRNLRLWGGDMTKFWDSVRQYLYNHKQGLQGHIGLNPDPEIAMEMKNRINDLFNVYRKETRDANPDRTTLPKRKGQDSRDVVIRSRRMDRINSYDETALAKMPFSYESAVKNYLPAENPLAELQSPEQFAQAMEIDTEIARLAAQGNVEPLELQLHQQDLLHPAEYIDVENGKLRVRSMFDPTQAILEPMESEPEVSASATQFMPEAPIEATKNDKRTNVGISFMPASEEDYAYRGQHKAPDQESGSPLNKVTQSIYPDDFYDLPFEKTLQYYGSGEPRSDSESLSAILSAKDKPNAKVKVYRAVPKYTVQIDSVKAKEIEDRISKFEKLARLNPWSEDFKKQLDDALAERPQVISDINAGDWVTPSRSYAVYHGESALNGQYRILSKSVPASHLFTEGNSLSEFGYNPPSAKGIQFMPAETERYPTSERGMYSGLQKTIDEKVQGKFASPDQLKAIVTNPQNAKAEELKWSGVLGEIDRLAAENQGKVPKDKVMDYLRNEGAVKFEEVTLSGTSIFLVTDVNGEVMGSGGTESDAIADAANALSMDFLDVEDIIEKSKSGYQGEEETLFLKEDEGESDSTKFAQYQLPSGTNYREVVMTMPQYSELENLTFSYSGLAGGMRMATSSRGGSGMGNTDALAKADWERQYGDKIKGSQRRIINSYTSSHFPDTPNYVAHMRLNERTDAQGNEGLFIEELQSDRHQAGRDVGYIDEKLDIPEGYRIEKSQIRGFIVFDPEGISLGGKNTEIEAIQAARMNAGLSGAKMQVPDAPFRKDWSIQLFKRALRDAVDSDKKWIGWTTGIEQVKRYEEAMRQAVDEITWDTPKGYQKAFAAIKNGNTVLAGKINDDGSVYDSDTADANGKQLSEVLGKEVASKILAENSGTATGDDLTVGGEGMKGFYDQILPKEIGKYVAKMGGKVEKSIINKNPLSDRPNTFYKNPETGEIEKMPQGNPIWRVDITPEMAGKVRGGQLQFMPAVQTIPERFTGTGKKGEERRGRYVAPPEFWTRFDIGDFNEGGKFFDLETGEDITNKNYATGTIDVTGKRPSLVSDSIIDDMPDEKGRTWKTNLFRKSAGWNWISENPPEVATIGSKEKPNPVLISVENNPDHFYSLKVDFPNGVKLARYPKGGEPRLRPTKKGQIKLGNEVGRIRTSYGLEHIVYDSISIGQPQFMPAETNDLISEAKNFNNLDDFIKSRKRKLFHFSKSENPTFLREGGTFSGNVSTFEERDIPRYEGGSFQERNLIELYTDGEILDAAGDTELTPFNIINGGGDNVEFNEMLKKASQSIGVNEPPYHFPWNSKDWLGKTGNTWRKTLQSELSKKGYVGYQPGAEIVITDPSTVKTKAQLVDIWNASQKNDGTRFMPAEQPAEYEPISARIRPLEGISAPTKMVGAKALSLGEIEPPVRGKAMLPDMELGTTKSDDKLTKLKEFAPKTEDKEGYIGVKSIGNKEGQLKFADLLDSNVEQTKNNLIFLKKRLEQEKNSREKELYRDKIRFNNDLIQQFGDASKTIRYLDNNNIPFQIDNSLRTGSVYIKTGTKDFRFSSHSQTPYGFKTLNGFDDVLSHFEPILTPDISEKGIQSSDIITSAKPAPDAVIKPFSNALVSSAGLINFLPAFHGTPFDVDKFKLEKIGTGEGAQAYGWGLYFAQARSVGEKYKENLSEYKATLDGRKVAPETLYVTFGPKYPGYLDGVINSQGLIERWLRQPNAQNPYPDGSQRSNLWNEVSSRAKSEGKGGNLYKVDLDVKDEDLLDWDKPFSEQSDNVREKLVNILPERSSSKIERVGSVVTFRGRSGVEKNNGEIISNSGKFNTINDFVDYVKNNVSENDPLIVDPDGRSIYFDISNGDPKKASELLLASGIPGIRYLDGMSRTSASDINRRDELLKEGAQLRKTLENNPKDWEMRKQFKDWLTASEQELAALEKQIKSAETSPTHNYVVFDENLITILDKNDKPVQGELPRATGLQFMPASPVTKTQTGYDDTYLKSALASGINGKVNLTRPIKPNEALPLLSQRIPITNEVDKDSFDYNSRGAVILYYHNGKPVTFKYDPQLIRRPQFKDISVEHSGKVVQLAMADRHTASGGDMGGPIHPWLKSLEEVEIYDPVTGQYLIGKWANNEWKPAKSMKDKSRAGATDLLVYTMDKETHGSNLRSIRIISNEIDNAKLTQAEKNAFLIIANKAVKTYRLSDQNATINDSNKSIEEIKTKLEKETDKDKISKLNSELNSELKRISTAEQKIKNYIISQDETDFSAIIRNYKTAMTRYQNKTGSEEAYKRREEELKDYMKTPAFKKLQKEVNGVKMVELDNTFDGRKAAGESLKGLTINKFNVDHILTEISDFENGGLHHFVASVELSKNPNLMAVYLGDDPEQAKFMSKEEAAAAKIFKANPKFVIHEAYSWLMLGPKNGNDFLNTNPKTHLDYFPWFKQQWADLKTDPAARDRILKLGNDNLMNTMRDQKSIPLAMPKK